jgi:hypothetical protein
VTALRTRIEGLDWDGLRESIDSRGYGLTRPVLGAKECDALIALFDDDSRYRSVIDMRRHRFGSGVYKYFDRPSRSRVRHVVSRIRSGTRHTLGIILHDAE